VEAGIPFYAFLNSGGEMIANSIRLADGKPAASSPGKANIGYPEKPEEIAWFMTMLKKAVPAMSSDETATVETCLRESASTH
jgi:hypothetical protein